MQGSPWPANSLDPHLAPAARSATLSPIRHRRNPFAMLRVTDLTVEIGHRLLVDEASFTIAPGDVVGLVGPNGAGKTTLLRTLAEAATASGASGKGDPRVQLVGALAWLPQESPPTSESTGLARLLSARGLDKTRDELERARRRIEASQDQRARDRAIRRFSQ